MKALAELLKLIQKLYGKKALSKTIGTRTNVITLPDKETKRFLNSELNIEAASDAATQKAFKDVEKLIPDIPKMNDQEILTFKNNLQRLDNRLNPPSAEIVDIGTKQPVSPTGIKQLTEQAGQKSPPGSLMGDLESRLNQLRASGKKLEDIAKGKEPSGMSFSIPEKGIFNQPTTADDLFKMITENPYRSGGPLDPKTGIVRTAAREILEKNLKAGKIDIPDKAAKDAILKSYQGGTDPIDVIRQTYGEGILEQLDDIADELNKAKDYKDIQKILQREKLFDVKPKKTYGYDEGSMTDEELRKVLKEAEKDKPKTVKKAYEEGELKGTGLDDLMKGFDDPDEFATGGRVGFADGTNTEDEENTVLSNPTAFSPVSAINKIGKMLSNPVVKGAISYGIGGAPALGNFIKGQIAGDIAADVISQKIKSMLPTSDSGSQSIGKDYGVDAVTSDSVAPDASAGGAAGAAAASAAGSNDAGVGTFEKGGRVGFAYGSGLKLFKLLQKAGTNLKKAIREAIDNINPTGDKKLDADMAVDDMLETYNIDRDAVDGYDILNAYDEAYKTIATPGSKVMFSPAETKFAKDIGATKMAERIEIMEKYPGIDPKLVDKILIDDNPQRKAEVLATLDEAFTMMKKGMSDDEILTTFKKTPRTKQASGGVAYLMGL